MTEVTQIEYTQEEQHAALVHFFNLASGHCHSGARVAAGILLGLYNGPRFPFDLTDLRLLDQRHFGMAMALLDMDRRPVMEVHALLDLLYGRSDFGARFEHLAHLWKMKGRCKKEWLQPVERIGELQIGGAA